MCYPNETNNSLNRQCDRAMIRFARIVHIGTMSPDGEAASELKDAFDELNLDDLKHIEALNGLESYLKGDPDDEDDEDDEDEEEEEADWDPDQVLEFFYEHRLSGFLVEVETPSNDYGSWGSCYLRWFYGEELQAIILQAAEWAATVKRRK